MGGLLDIFNAGSDAAPATAATPAPTDLGSQAAAIQQAIAKLQMTNKNDPTPYFQMAAGFGAPTKSGSFFENLGGANAGLAEYTKNKREQDLKVLGAQAQLLGMQADLPLKQAQTEAAQLDVEQQKALMGALGGRAMVKAKPGVQAAPAISGILNTETGKPAASFGEVVSNPSSYAPAPVPQELVAGAQPGQAVSVPPGMSTVRQSMAQRAAVLMQFPKYMEAGTKMWEQAQKGAPEGYTWSGDFTRLVPAQGGPGDPSQVARLKNAEAWATVGAENAKTTHRVGEEAKYQTTEAVINGVKVQVPKDTYRQMFPLGMEANTAAATAPKAPVIAAPGEAVFTPDMAPKGGKPMLGEREIDKATAGKDADIIKATSEAAVAADRTLAGIRTAQAKLGDFETGQAGPVKMWLGQHLIAAGADPSKVDAKLGKIESAEQLSKVFFDIASKRTRELGGREPGFVLQMIATNSPALELLPNSNKFMLSSFAMDAQREKDMAAEQQRYVASVGSLRGFDEWFNQSHPLESYVAKAYIEAGAPVQLPPGDAGKKMFYTLPDGTQFVPPGSKTVKIMDHSKMGQ
jgi:hypothetical protein